jgi:hypothetical protein
MDQKFDNLELEHLLGYHGRNYKSVLFNPGNPNEIVYSVGGLVCLEQLVGGNTQQILRAHDMPVTAIAISSRCIYFKKKGNIKDF